MNAEVVAASFRLDWQRTRKPVMWAVLLMLLGAAIAALPGVGAVLGLLIVATGSAAVAGTSMTGMMERLQGRVAWWRTLPASATDLMLGRLLAVASRAVLAALGLFAAWPLLARTEILLPAPSTILVGWMLLTCLLASTMMLVAAVGLRWRVERVLVALFLVVLFADLISNNATEAWLEANAGPLLQHLLELLGSGNAWLVMLPGASLLLASLLVSLWIAVRAVAVAEERTAPGMPVDTPHLTWRGLRYPAMQRQVLLAITMMHLRIAAERMPQQVLFLVVGAIALPYLPESLQYFGATYLPIIAISIPGQLVFRTVEARGSGSLEGWATLPVRRELVAIGAVIAAAILGLLATLLISLVRIAADGEMTVPVALGLWGAITAATSMSNGMAAWFKPRHFVLAMFLGLLAVGGMTVAVMVQLMVGGQALMSMPSWPPIAAGLFGLLLVAPLGGALYGRGLERYELVRR